MREIITEALVLAKEPVGEFDQRVTLFTERAGKVSAKVTSGRKITAKLSPHLEPFTLATVRLVPGRGERNGRSGFQVADALRSNRLSRFDVRLLRLLAGILLEGQPEPELWERIRSGTLSPADALRVAGFDPAHASCPACGAPNPGYFLLVDLEYRCRRCLTEAFPRSAYVEL